MGFASYWLDSAKRPSKMWIATSCVGAPEVQCRSMVGGSPECATRRVPPWTGRSRGAAYPPEAMRMGVSTTSTTSATRRSDIKDHPRRPSAAGLADLQHVVCGRLHVKAEAMSNRIDGLAVDRRPQAVL